MNPKLRDKDLIFHLDLRNNQGRRPVDETTINFCQGTGTTMVHERNGYRMSSGGSDVIDCGNNDNINFTTQMSVSAWIYMNSTVTAVSKVTTALSGFAYLIAYNSDNKVYFQMTGNGTTVTYGNTTVTYPTNQWVHVTCTYNGAGATNTDKLKIYFNGREITSKVFVGTIPTSIFRTSSPLTINKFNGSTYGNGKLGLIRAFKRCLTPTEVMSEYVNTKATNR